MRNIDDEILEVQKRLQELKNKPSSTPKTKEEQSKEEQLSTVLKQMKREKLRSKIFLLLGIAITTSYALYKLYKADGVANKTPYIKKIIKLLIPLKAYLKKSPIQPMKGRNSSSSGERIEINKVTKPLISKTIKVGKKTPYIPEDVKKAFSEGETVNIKKVNSKSRKKKDSIEDVKNKLKVLGEKIKLTCKLLILKLKKFSSIPEVARIIIILKKCALIVAGLLVFKFAGSNKLLLKTLSSIRTDISSFVKSVGGTIGIENVTDFRESTKSLVGLAFSITAFVKLYQSIKIIKIHRELAEYNASMQMQQPSYGQPAYGQYYSPIGFGY